MLPSIFFKTCVPREEILAGELSVDLFAAKLRSVVEGYRLLQGSDLTRISPGIDVLERLLSVFTPDICEARKALAASCFRTNYLTNPKFINFSAF